MSESNNGGSEEREGSTSNAFTGYLPDAVYCAYYRGLLEAVAKRHSDDIRMVSLYQQQLAGGCHLAAGDAAANLNKTNGCEAASPPLEAEKEQLRSSLCAGGGGEIAEGGEGEPRGQITFRPHPDVVSWTAPTPCHLCPRVIFQRQQRRRQAAPLLNLNQTTRQVRQQYAKRRRTSSPMKDNQCSNVANVNEARMDGSSYDNGKKFDAGMLLPELLESIFRYLDVTSRGRAAQVLKVNKVGTLCTEGMHPRDR